MKSYPFVSIVFPNFNGGIQPMECLSSIYNLNYPKEKLEVIVIDNNSTDGSLQKVKSQSIRQAQDRKSKVKSTGQKLEIIENKENVGFAKAINQGIKNSHGQYIFITNDDMIFDKDSLKNLIEHSLTHPDVGIMGGKIFSKNKPSNVISCGYMMNKWTGNVYPSPNYNIIHEPDWIQGCAMLVPKAVLNKIGMLDENFSLIYFEDLDLCFRSKKAGYSIAYIPSAHFWHGQSKTMDKDLPYKYYQWYKNKILFVIKNLPLKNALAVLSIQIFLVTPYRALLLRDGRLIPFLKGILWNIKNLSESLPYRKIQ